jgi:hypothetical protein
VTIREKVILEGEDQASQAFDRAGGSFDKMGKTLKRVAVAGGLAIAASGLARVGTQAINMAIDAEEAAAAFDTTFGAALPQASRFVDDFANKAGFATYELEQMLAVTGNVVQGIGATEEQSAALAEEMATLAGDVASFSNAAGGAPAVMQALQSAINGEREALKTYGLAISEAEVQERALTDTRKESADELTRLEKANATMAIAYEKAGKAVGDLDRTQDSSANTLRRIQARLKEAGVAAGQEFLPALEDLLPVAEDLIPILGEVGGMLAQLAGNAATAASGPLSKLPDLFDGLSIAANSFIHVGAGVANVIAEVFSAGHYDGALAETARFAAHANDIRKINRELRAEMEKGRPAADVYADGILALARASDLSEEGLDRMATATGADTQQQLDAIMTLQAYGEAQGWRAENLAILKDRYHELQGAVDMATGSEEGLYGVVEGFSDGWADNTTAIYENNAALEEVPEAARDAADEILEMEAAAQEAAEAFRDDLAEEANDFITGFEKLPKRAKTTMDQFEKNLTDRVSAQAEFWSNLAALAEAGFGDLAEAIRMEGPEQAGLLEDLVGDMERAAELDDMIREGGEQMRDLTDEYATALEQNGDQILTPLGEFGQDMIDKIGEGIKAGNLTGILLAEVQAAVNRVTGRSWAPPSPSDTGGTRFHDGTWEVPGSGDFQATLQGGEIVVPAQTGGRAAFARELATELGRQGGTRSDRPNISVNVQVTVPRGTTVSEAIAEAAAQGAIEAIMN